MINHDVKTKSCPILCCQFPYEFYQVIFADDGLLISLYDNIAGPITF